MHKNENGKIYCTSCELIINSNADIDKIGPTNIKPLIQEDIENNIKTLLNTPPLTWKELKAKLKKERENQQKFRDKKDSK